MVELQEWEYLTFAETETVYCKQESHFSGALSTMGGPLVYCTWRGVHPPKYNYKYRIATK